MSLRAFHIVFVVSALTLGLVVCGWALAAGESLLTLSAALATGSLAVYARVFVKRHARGRSDV